MDGHHLGSCHTHKKKKKPREESGGWGGCRGTHSPERRGGGTLTIDAGCLRPAVPCGLEEEGEEEEEEEAVFGLER